MLMRSLESMTYKLQFTQTAREDLQQLHQFYQKNFSKKVADDLVKTMQKKIAILTFSPDGGIDFNQRIGHSLIPNQVVRLFVTKKTLIFYVVQDDLVLILRLVPTKTDYLNQLENLFKVFGKSDE